MSRNRYGCCPDKKTAKLSKTDKCGKTKPRKPYLKGHTKLLKPVNLKKLKKKLKKKGNKGKKKLKKKGNKGKKKLKNKLKKLKELEKKLKKKLKPKKKAKLFG